MAEPSPVLAAGASLLVPGLGQLWLGRRERGGLILLVALLLAGLIWWLPVSPLTWLALALFWGYNVWDAYQLADPARRASLSLLVLAGVLPIYIIGWQVTNINVNRLLSNAAKVRPLVAGIFQPSVIRQDVTLATATHEFFIPCPAPAALASEPTPLGATIAVTEPCGAVGDPLTVVGEGFPPDQEVGLWWVNPVNARSRVRAFGAYQDFAVGADGRFEAAIVVPPAIPPGEGMDPEAHTIEVSYVAERGGWELTETFWLVAQRMGETIAQALMATAVGALLAMPFSFFGARNLMAGNPGLKVLYYFSRIVMNVLRSVEPLIMAIVFVVWVGLGPFAGVLALIVHTIAALGKLYSESIESIDEGPIEAMRATGANQLQIIAYGVVPQIVPPWIAFTVYRWDINVRMSTIIGFVGGGGIGFLLAQWIRLLDFRAAGAAIWAIAIVVIVLDTLSAKVREKVV